MAMLHIVNKSPFEKMAFESCLKHLSEGDSVIMIEDAVVGAVRDTKFSAQIEQALKGNALYVLSGDLAARGLSKERIISGINVVGYDGFVDLTVACNTTQSWL